MGIKNCKTAVRIMSQSTTTTEFDSTTGEEHTTTVEKTTMIGRSTEPDYIKLYTAMWCEFNQIPQAHRSLFLELVTRMSYCNKTDLGKSQIVCTGGPFADSICAVLGWKNKVSLKKGLKALSDCGAIKRIGRGFYQINPSYAGKGEWKYNPRLDRGGIEDLVATFDFRKGTVETNVVWADDGTNCDINRMMREGMGYNPAIMDVSITETTKTTSEPTTSSNS